MEDTYLLFWADFDENESGVEKLKGMVDIVEHLGDDQMEAVNELLIRGYWYGEWHQYHLVKLSDVG